MLKIFHIEQLEGATTTDVEQVHQNLK